MIKRSWTGDEDQTLRERWRAGESASEIGKTMEPVRTRCAVLGRVHRLGLSHPDTKRPKPAPKIRPPSILNLRQDDPGPLSPLVAMTDLGDAHCRWPYDTADGLVFCARQRNGKSTFCEMHGLVAHQPKNKAV